MYKTLRFVSLLAVCQLCCASHSLAEDTKWVRVVPKETDEILANPGMGWETFHKTAKQDENLPAWIPSTIHYARWSWTVLEPEQGKIDYDFLDGILRETRDSGQQLAFRVMCCSPYPRRTYHPEWLRTIGGEIVKTRHGDSSEVEVPVLDDPKILAAHLDFIKRLGARYDGHPDITRLDLGSVGWWGEWHMSRSSNATMPTPETQKKIVDAYLAAFQKTPLVMLIGGDEMLRYAVKNRTGWRADSLGDLGSFSQTWNHMFGSYPKRIQAIQDLNAWLNGPIAFEPPAAVSELVEKDWPLRWIFNYGLAVHGSSFSGKSGRLPDNVVLSAASVQGQQVPDKRPAKTWTRTGPLGDTPEHVTDDYPLSDQENMGSCVKFEPMTDEFEGDGLDLDRWNRGLYWWRGRQPALFSEKNVTVSDGKLHLTMRKEKVPEEFEKRGYKDYTSAALHSKVRSSYGYYEVKAKPMNSGGSSSFWFQVEETPGWLTEIDVFEIGGKAKGFEHKYNMNAHVFRTPTKKEHWSVGGVWVAPWRLADDYHVYGLEWTPDEVKYYVDGVVVRAVENTHWHQPLFLIFDSETMPKWFGMPDDEDLPSTYSIEYVRAWKRQDERQ